MIKGRGQQVRTFTGVPACLAAAALLAAATSLPAAEDQDTDGPSRLSPLDFKVIRSDAPVTGEYAFIHPLTGERALLSLRPAPGPEDGLVGVLAQAGVQVLTLAPKKKGLGWQGELRGVFSSCGQDRVTVTDLLPLGDRVILRMEADPPPTPCAFLEDRSTSRLVVAPTANPVRLRSSREIVSSRTKEKIGLAGQPGVDSTPIVAGAVSVEGGTELRFLDRKRSLDGSVWIEVEAIVSPAPGIEPPRGFLRAEELKIDSSIVLERLEPPGGPPGR